MPAPCQPYVSPMCPNIEEFVPTRWWWRSQRMLRPVGSSTSRSASTHSSLYQRCYSVLWKNPLTNDYFQSLLFKGSESVKSIGRCTQCNRGFQQVSLQTQAWSLKLSHLPVKQVLSPPLFRAETVTGASAGVLLQYQKVFGAFLQKQRWLSKIKITFNFFGKRPWPSKIQNHLSTEGVWSFF